MKTASLLFGLLTTACGAGQPEPSYPLCDPQGAPACGNIGQVGRARETSVVDGLRALPTTATSAAIRIIPAVHVLLGPSRPRTQAPAAPAVDRLRVEARETSASGPFARPLTDHREGIVCGNVMGKGSSRRVCRNAEGAVVSSVALHPDEE